MMYEELYNKESNHKCSSIRYSVCIPFACELCCLFEYSEIEKEPNGTGSAVLTLSTRLGRSGVGRGGASILS